MSEKQMQVSLLFEKLKLKCVLEFLASSVAFPQNYLYQWPSTTGTAIEDRR